MADINVTGKGTFAGNNFTVPAANSAVTFHAADDPCTICFSNSATFGTNSLALPKGGPPTSKNVASRVATNYTVNASGYTCPAGGAKPSADTTYTIDMGSSMGHGHGKR